VKPFVSQVERGREERAWEQGWSPSPVRGLRSELVLKMAVYGGEFEFASTSWRSDAPFCCPDQKTLFIYTTRTTVKESKKTARYVDLAERFFCE